MTQCSRGHDQAVWGYTYYQATRDKSYRKCGLCARMTERRQRGQPMTVEGPEPPLKSYVKWETVRDTLEHYEAVYEAASAFAATAQDLRLTPDALRLHLKRNPR